MANGNGYYTGPVGVTGPDADAEVQKYGGAGHPTDVSPAVQPSTAQQGQEPWYTRYGKAAGIGAAEMAPFAVGEAIAAPGLGLIPAAGTLALGALSGIGSEAMADFTYDPKTGTSPAWARPVGGLLGGGWAGGARTLMGEGVRGIRAISAAARGNPLTALGVGGIVTAGGSLAERLLEGSHLAAYAMQHPIQTASAVASTPLFRSFATAVTHPTDWTRGVAPWLQGTYVGTGEKPIQQGINWLTNPALTGSTSP